MEQYKVTNGTDFSLNSYAADDTSAFTGTKAEAKRRLKDLRKQLADLQFLLWAEDKHKLLVVLQAMDTGGKDGTIRNVFKGVNPQGVWVANFKAPTDEELAHDYLWRVHPHTPGNGEIAVFNRSHYEDVLVVRVLELASEERWSRRYGHIVDFEKRLVDEGTTIVKIYLNISRDEQAARLQARLDDPERNWKFNIGDLDHRKLWDQYMDAFQDAITRTATEAAPWYVVPANVKWYRNIVIAQILVDTLKGLAMEFPDPEKGLDSVVIV